MTEARRYAFSFLLSSATRSPVDRQRAVIALRAAAPEERDEVRRMILDRRAEWLTWLTIGQRKWQTNTSRRPSRQRHHDSGKIREQYVTKGAVTA